MHPIKRGALVLLLSLGAIGGFTHGFARMAQCHSSCSASGPSHRDQFEDHIADVCTRAAQRAYDEREAAAGQAHGAWGGPQQQWGGPPPQWGPPPQYVIPQYAPPQYAPAPVAPAIVVAPVAPVAPAAPEAPEGE